MTSNIKENIKHMNSLGTQIIEISTKVVEPSNEDLRHRVSFQKQQRKAKNDLVSELMTLSESRKMKLNESDSASLD